MLTMLSNPVAVSCVAYKCFVDRKLDHADGITTADGNSLHDGGAISAPYPALQPIIAELRAMDTASILDQPMQAGEALQAILGEPLQAGLRTTLRSVHRWLHYVCIHTYTAQDARRTVHKPAAGTVGLSMHVRGPAPRHVWHPRDSAPQHVDGRRRGQAAIAVLWQHCTR